MKLSDTCIGYELSEFTPQLLALSGLYEEFGSGGGT